MHLELIRPDKASTRRVWNALTGYVHAYRAQLEQHHLRGSCGSGVRGLQAARQEPGLSHAGSGLIAEA